MNSLVTAIMVSVAIRFLCRGLDSTGLMVSMMLNSIAVRKMLMMTVTRSNSAVVRSLRTRLRKTWCRSRQTQTLTVLTRMNSRLTVFRCTVLV